MAHKGVDSGRRRAASARLQHVKLPRNLKGGVKVTLDVRRDRFQVRRAFRSVSRVGRPALKGDRCGLARVATASAVQADDGPNGARPGRRRQTTELCGGLTWSGSRGRGGFDRA